MRHHCRYRFSLTPLSTLDRHANLALLVRHLKELEEPRQLTFPHHNRPLHFAQATPQERLD
jgi:hypothetical protein